MRFTLIALLTTLALGCQGPTPASGGGGSGGGDGGGGAAADGGDDFSGNTDDLVSTTEAEARAVCDQANILSAGVPVSDAEWGSILINAEALRDDGLTKAAFIVGLSAQCDNRRTQEAFVACGVCWSRVADVVY